MKAAKQKKAAPPRLLTNGAYGEPTHDDIAHRAYSLWEQQGGPQDHQIGIWLQAESQLRQSQSRQGVRA
jgi:hypothetical protein